MSAKKLRLDSARITNFRCFADSGDVPIDRHVTTLIAENENGKTAFLEAIAWCLSGDGFDGDDLRSGTPGDPPHAIVALDFSLPGELNEAWQLNGLPDLRKIRVARKSDGTRTVIDPATGREIDVDVPELASAFYAARDSVIMLLNSQGIPDPHATARTEVVAGLSEASWGDPPIADGLLSRLEAEVLPVVAADQAVAIRASIADFGAAEKAPYPAAFAAIAPFLPQIVYFDDRVDNLRDIATYDDVAGGGDDFRTMVNLSTLAGVDLAAIAAKDPHAKQELSDTGSRTVTEDARGFWEGGEIEMRISFTETQMVVNVEHLGRRQRPSRRSRGLQWFLGFFVNFRAETRGRLEGAILLLDEPGLHLHLKQQSRLLQFFEEIARTNQVIYSTHLPSMIAANKLVRLRLLDKDPDNRGASIVAPKVQALRSNLDVMRPVRAILGMGIAQSLGVGDTTLVVEGPTDVMILDAMRIFCEAAKKPTLPNAVTVLATIGAGKKMIPFVTLLANEVSSGAVLVDDDAQGHAAAKEVAKQFGDLVPALRTHTGASLDAKPSGMEIEDLFSRSYFLRLVNSAHSTIVAGWVDISANEIDSKLPINDQLAALFTQRKYGDYRKIHAARELQARALTRADVPDDTSTRRFSELFGRLSEALAAQTKA